MLKRIIFPLIVVAIFSSTTIIGQPGPRPPKPCDRVKMLKEKLTLTEEQVREVKSILESTHKKMEEMREKMDKKKRESMNEVKKMKDKEDEAIGKILTAEQLEKFEELKKEMKSHRPPMGEHRGMRPGYGDRPPMDGGGPENDPGN